jgi:DNA-binding phage protein
MIEPQAERALSRLAAYRRRREAMHADVRAAVAAGVSKSEVARTAGLSRQYVIKLCRPGAR